MTAVSKMQKGNEMIKSNQKHFRIIRTPMGSAVIDPETAKQVHGVDIIEVIKGLFAIVDYKTRRQIGIGRIRY